MGVTVRVHGALRSAALGSAVALSLPESATVGDLLARLGGRFGSPFADVAASREVRLPRQLRVFVGGELVDSRDEPLAAHGGTAPTRWCCSARRRQIERKSRGAARAG